MDPAARSGEWERRVGFRDGHLVDLKVSPDGFLYYLARGAGSVNRIGFAGAGDNIPPAVSITNPANNASVPRKSTVTIAATASDNVAVTRVDFLVNGAVQCTDTTAPYTCNWRVPSAPNKRFQLQARAFDQAGNSASAAVSVRSQ